MSRYDHFLQMPAPASQPLRVLGLIVSTGCLWLSGQANSTGSQSAIAAEVCIMGSGQSCSWLVNIVTSTDLFVHIQRCSCILQDVQVGVG